MAIIVNQSAIEDGSMYYNDGVPGWIIRHDLVRAGYGHAGDHREISYIRFGNVNIPQGSTISFMTITFNASTSRVATVVNTKISAHDVDNSTAAPVDTAEFLVHYAARTTAEVLWNNLPAWTHESDYTSPDISSVLQEIVDRPGWVSGNAWEIFWGDFDDLSDHAGGHHREAHNTTDGGPQCKINVTYTPPGSQVMRIQIL